MTVINRVARFKVGSAQIRGIKKAQTVRTQFADERIVEALVTGQRGLKRIVGGEIH
jgi:hypothetical protein